MTHHTPLFQQMNLETNMFDFLKQFYYEVLKSSFHVLDEELTYLFPRNIAKNIL